MQVEVDDGDVAHRCLDPGDRPDTNRAVAAEDENFPVTLEKRVGDTSRSCSHHLHDGFEVLGPRPGPVGSPRNDRRVTEIADGEARAAE
jgi:hypothetical protein